MTTQSPSGIGGKSKYLLCAAAVAAYVGCAAVVLAAPTLGTNSVVYKVDAVGGVIDMHAATAPTTSPVVHKPEAVSVAEPPVVPPPVTKAVVVQAQEPHSAEPPGATPAPTQSQELHVTPASNTNSVPVQRQEPPVAPKPSATSIPAPSQKPLALAPFKKPAWLTEISLGIKEGYDDNVYMSGVGKKFLPATYTVPAGSVAALKDRGSWVTTVSPKVAMDFAPVLGNKNLQSASFVYAPDLVRYHDQSTEDYDAQRFTTTIKAKVEPFSLNFNNSFVYIDGSDFGPVYPGALLSAWNTVAPRERREQIQDRANPVIQYDQDTWFIRASASLLYYDLMTTLTNVTGYQNYVDRYDVNGGVDLGYKIKPQLAVTFGYRYGHQYQQKLSFSPDSSSSDYERLLLGIEGKPWKWLDVKIQGGPDFRNYEPDTATHITPVRNDNVTTYYGEAVIVAKPSTVDTVTFKYRGFQWVSCLGKVPYFDSYYDLGYNRKLTTKLALDLGTRLGTADYTVGNLAPSDHRNDWQYTLSAGLGYAVNANLSLNAAYSLDLGRNAQDNITNPQTREYDHQLLSLGAKYGF
jgi:hypothetical protein